MHVWPYTVLIRAQKLGCIALSILIIQLFLHLIIGFSVLIGMLCVFIGFITACTRSSAHGVIGSQIVVSFNPGEIYWSCTHLCKSDSTANLYCKLCPTLLYCKWGMILVERCLFWHFLRGQCINISSMNWSSQYVEELQPISRQGWSLQHPILLAGQQNHGMFFSWSTSVWSLVIAIQFSFGVPQCPRVCTLRRSILLCSSLAQQCSLLPTSFMRTITAVDSYFCYDKDGGSAVYGLLKVCFYYSQCQGYHT